MSFFDDVVGQRPRKAVAVPRYPREVVAVGILASEMDAIMKVCSIAGKDPSDPASLDQGRMISMVIAASMRDDSGEPLFSKDEAKKIRDLPNDVYLALQAAAMEVNGMRGDEGN